MKPTPRSTGTSRHARGKRPARPRRASTVRAALTAATRGAAAKRTSGMAAYLCLLEVGDRAPKLSICGAEHFAPRRASAPTATGRRATVKAIARGLDWTRLGRVLFAAGAKPRLVMLSHLLEGNGTHRSLQGATGLRPGPLYHHLDQLRLAGLVEVPARDSYALTAAGRNLSLAVMAVGRLVARV